MLLILQQDRPDDYVIATGESHSVREFCESAFREAGMEIEWRGEGASERGVIDSVSFPVSPGTPRPGDEVIFIDPVYFRPTEVARLEGDASKAGAELGWEPSVRFGDLVRIMVRADIQDLLNLQACRDVVQKIINGKDR
jgi:GDPmannose 4,6-dehydratase